MLDRAMRDLGLDWRYLSFEVPHERLAEALTGVDALGLRGVRLLGNYCNEGKAAPSRTERAKRTGRLTHLTRHDGKLQGDDATGPALIEALGTKFQEEGSPNGKQIALLGAGGCSASLADVLVEQRAKSIYIADKNSERSAALVLATREFASQITLEEGEEPTQVEQLGWESNWFELPEGIDWIISTATWPKEENQKIAEQVAAELNEGQLLVDMGIGSNRSPLLLLAEHQGLKLLDGVAVMVAETALAFEAWTGQSIDREPMRDSAEEFLGI